MLGRTALLSLAFWVAFAGVLRLTLIPPESCGADSLQAIQSSAAAAKEWMKRNQLPDGRFVYEYNSGTDIISAEYNEVRHAGVAMALYQAAGRYDDRDALAAADRALTWEQDHLVSEGDRTALAPYPASSSLGASALMLAGLTDRRSATGDGRYDDLMRQLGRYLVAQQRPDGGFYVYYDFTRHEPDRVSTSIYYPGEAMFALALLDKVLPGEAWDEPALRTAAFIATRRDDAEDIDLPPLADQWAAYGLAELAEKPLTDAEIGYARSLAGRFGLLTRTEAQRQGSTIGLLVRRRESRAAGMGTWVEALAALWRLASTDHRLADLRAQILERTVCAAGILAQRQASAGDAAAAPRPGLVEGAWFRSAETRMDDQQHAFSGLTYTTDAMQGRVQRAADAPATAGHR